VPDAGFVGISGVESGKAAPFVGGPPGVELHTVVDARPTGEIGDMDPVVLTTVGVGTIDVGMAPNGFDGPVMVDDVLGTVKGPGTGAGVIEGIGSGGTAGGCGAGMVVPGTTLEADDSSCWENTNGAVAIALVGAEELGGSADVTGAAEIDGAPVVLAVADIAVTGAAGGVPGVICPDGAEQVTTVPGVVGSEASGTGASVVPGVPSCVVAENGLGPLSGEVTIAAGVVGRPMAVLPMVETCARQAGQPSSSMPVVNGNSRIALRLPLPACPAYVFRTETLSPSARLTIGLRTTWSPGLTPSCTSTSLPKSRAIEIFCRRTAPFSTTATCRPS
jgi:hypothetical protein